MRWQYLALWSVVREVPLVDGPDQFKWKWTTSSQFSSRSAYLAFFEGTSGNVGGEQHLELVCPIETPIPRLARSVRSMLDGGPEAKAWSPVAHRLPPLPGGRRVDGPSSFFDPHYD